MNISILIVFAITVLAGTITIASLEGAGKWIKYLLSFSGAYIFGLTVVHLLPETYELGTSVKYISLAILGGFFLQIVLEYFTQGIEHGHIHIHKEKPFPIMLFIALFIHAFFEGNLLGDESDSMDTWGYVFGLTIHKIPVAIVLGIILKAHFNKGISILLVTIFALATPLGSFLSSVLDENMVSVVNGVVAGSFLHISTTILFESTPDHKFDFKKFLLAIIGALASLLLL